VIGRRLAPFGLALVAAIGLLGTPAGPAAPTDVRAATPDLTIVSAARYEVQPSRRRVHITLDLTLTNRLRDTKTTRYFFDEAFLAILPGTSGFKLSWDGPGIPSVRATKRTKTHTLLRLDLPQRIYGGRTANYRLSFNLKDPGGSATRDLRIGASLVSFPVWAFGTDSTPGSSVSVVFPKGFEVEVETGKIPKPTTLDDGRVVFRTGRLQEPLSFFAYLVGDRPGEYLETPVRTDVLGAPVELLVRSWPDDAPWAKRVGGLLTRSLPVLGDEIGLPWSHTEPLVVEEAVSRSTGGYAGLFDPGAGRVEIAYYAASFVVLHEAAHGWFNGALLADRWANEAFASFYAERAAADLKVKVRPDALTDALRAAAIPLNAWGAVGSESATAEDYAYAASLQLARLIAERAGPDGLRRVWADAAAGVGAYQPPTSSAAASSTTVADTSTAGTTESGHGPPDWRVLLDLLEDRTDATYDDLWRSWVARPTDVPLLDARADARDRYAALVAQAGDWRLPAIVREAMRSWRFEDATVLIDEAAAILDRRTEVQAAAVAAGLAPPAGLRATFEDDDGFDDAVTQAAAELEAIDRYAEAVALRPSGRRDSVLVTMGLWGETPEAELARAKAAFAEGDLDTAATSSARVAAIWADAEAIGRGRAVSLILLALAGLVAIVLALSMRRVRRRRRDRMMAHRIVTSDPRP
jgi:hypothetical protein